MRFYFKFFSSLVVLFSGVFFLFPSLFSSNISYQIRDTTIVQEKRKAPIKKNFLVPMSELEIMAYDQKLNEIANNPPPKEPVIKIVKDPKTGVETSIIVEPEPAPPNNWPVVTTYPNTGAILPFKRIVAYYGNLYSTKMGALGEYPETEMFSRLDAEVKKWEIADPKTPVVPALHYISVVAQVSAGKDGKYRARMPDVEIDKVLKMAEKINAIVFLDFQVGFSTLEQELPVYEKYFKMPNVHLGIDAEFSMKNNIRPGKVVGTFDAVDINYAGNFLARIVKENNLPPKVLVVHRYTQKMITNYKFIRPLPEVQIVMHMDGWGAKEKKIGTYNQFIYKEPVQFTGFKLFYKNDIFEPNTTLFSPEELLKLNPRPSYIQYQ